MEKRKIQATGGASLTLTLPKSWTSYCKLSSKDEVLVKSIGPSLIVRPAQKSKQELTMEISLDNKPDGWITREMIGAFMAGADRIVLRSSRITASQNQVVRQTVQYLFGFEILEEASQKIVVRSVVDDTRFPVSESTLRIFAIVRSMFEDAMLAAQSGDKELARDIEQRDHEVNKFLHTIKRQYQGVVSYIAEGDINEVGFYRSVAIQLERIGDHAVKIAAHAAAVNKTLQLSSTFPDIKLQAHQLFEDTEKMLGDLDMRKAHTILDSNATLERLIYSSKRMKQSYEGALIEDSLDRLRGYLMNIAELTIDYRLLVSG